MESDRKFWQKRIRWLLQFIKLEHGIPSHLTFARVMARVDPKALECCMRQWFQKICPLSLGDIINFDGKTACASGHVNSDKKICIWSMHFHQNIMSP